MDGWFTVVSVNMCKKVEFKSEGCKWKRHTILMYIWFILMSFLNLKFCMRAILSYLLYRIKLWLFHIKVVWVYIKRFIVISGGRFFFTTVDHCVFEFDTPGVEDLGISTALMAVPVLIACPGAPEHVWWCFYCVLPCHDTTCELKVENLRDLWEGGFLEFCFDSGDDKSKQQLMPLFTVGLYAFRRRIQWIPSLPLNPRVSRCPHGWQRLSPTGICS